ncbi:MAG: hydrogenase expression/formation protein HypE [Verrucomicrobiota bacterium]
MTDRERILLAHGGGGQLSRELIDREIVSRFGAGPLEGLPDGATVPVEGDAVVFTTDSFVVQPIEFPGGNIGDLAVHGTVNDLAVCGAKPRWLSLALILEEGLELALLRRVLDRIKIAADDSGVVVATGDTKVVARGQCDGLFINTSGIGERLPGFDLSPAHLQEGDRVLVSGPIADHGFAVLASRENIHIQNGPQSDSAPVHRLVQAAVEQAADIRFMRDPTRGGLASVLNEMVESAKVGIQIQEESIPVSPGTHAVSELLGLDPLHVASEGRLLMVCGTDAAPAILEAWQAMPEGGGAKDIGAVTKEAGRVVLETLMGGHRLIDVPRGELLPRIC